MSRKLQEIEPTKIISIDENTKIDVSDLPQQLRNQVRLMDLQREKVSESEYTLYADKLALEMMKIQLNKAISVLLNKKKETTDAE